MPASDRPTRRIPADRAASDRPASDRAAFDRPGRWRALQGWLVRVGWATAGTALLIGVIAWACSRPQPVPMFDVSPSVYSPADDAARTWRGWVFTNRGNDPLTIHRVIYNDEHVACLANAWANGALVPDANTRTAALSPHESQIFFQDAPGATDSLIYRKKIEFIDVDTDRGEFRFKPGGTLARR